MLCYRIRTDAFILQLACIGLLVSCGSTTQHVSTSQQLTAASRAAGIEVLRDETVTVTRGDETFALAPIAAWASIPATDLPKGIDFAYAYVDATYPPVPRGYYRLRAVGTSVRLGAVAITIQFIGSAGNVAAEIPARAEIHSLSGPTGVRGIFITTGSDPAENRIVLWSRCATNGQCFLFGVFRVKVAAAT